MRFLLSLVISSFFFIVPLQGNAGDIGGTRLVTTAENKNTGGELAGSYIIDKNAGAIISQSSISISQFRFYSDTNFINQVPALSLLNFLPGTGNLVHAHQYFKPIRLKLIFPEHYYW